jgi:riboflavin kinase/FMN adenylyltransferase
MASGNRSKTVVRSFSSRVIKGEGIARTIGYPTLNLDRTTVDGRIPKKGVWAVWASVQSTTRAATLIVGVPFQHETRRDTKLELHFLRRAQIKPGTRVSVQLVRFLRPLERYTTKTALIQAIRRDRANAKKFLTPPSPPFAETPTQRRRRKG